MYFKPFASIFGCGNAHFPKKVFIGICLIYLNGNLFGLTAADKDTNSRNVPLGSEILRAKAPAHAFSENVSTQSSHNQRSPHHHHHHPTYNHKAQEAPSVPSKTEEAYSPNWYASHMNDPRMGFFFSSPSGVPTSSASLILENEQKQTPLVSIARPRSLSGFSSSLVKREIKYEGEEKRKRKKKKDTKGMEVEETSPLLKSTSTSTVAATNMTSTESNRTFVFTPLALASIVPLFFAQLFGMGMIPAAALITFPIFLLPIGLAAAVFLV